MAGKMEHISIPNMTKSPDCKEKIPGNHTHIFPPSTGHLYPAKAYQRNNLHDTQKIDYPNPFPSQLTTAVSMTSDLLDWM